MSLFRFTIALNCHPSTSQSLAAIHSRACLLFRCTEVLNLPEPLKKKTTSDPMTFKIKTERRKKKLEREILKLKKHQLKLKPIEEMQLDIKIQNRIEERRRDAVELSDEKTERRELLQKEWTRFKFKEHYHEIRRIESMIASQAKALKALQLESEELYQAAIKVDNELLPYAQHGPVNTPPIKGYSSPDGEYIDTTRKWE